jgi:hypothetical protein
MVGIGSSVAGQLTADAFLGPKTGRRQRLELETTNTTRVRLQHERSIVPGKSAYGFEIP